MKTPERRKRGRPRLRVPKTEPGLFDGGCRVCRFFHGTLFSELVELPLVFGLEFCGFARVRVFGEADALLPQHVQRPAVIFSSIQRSARKRRPLPCRGMFRFDMLVSPPFRQIKKQPFPTTAPVDDDIDPRGSTSPAVYALVGLLTDAFRVAPTHSFGLLSPPLQQFQ